MVEAAQSFYAEKERHYGHAGRRHAREEELCAAIEQAAEAIKSGPVTDDDLMIALAVREAQGR